MNTLSSEGPSTEISIRARYAETDAMGVVHHASYVVWLEQGRTELLRALGVSYRELEATGFFVVLSDLRVRYHASARYDDLILLRDRCGGHRARTDRLRNQRIDLVFFDQLDDDARNFVCVRVIVFDDELDLFPVYPAVAVDLLGGKFDGIKPRDSIRGGRTRQRKKHPDFDAPGRLSTGGQKQAEG